MKDVFEYIKEQGYPSEPWEWDPHATAYAGEQSPKHRGSTGPTASGWGAIAFIEDPDELGWGWALGYESSNAAKNTALKECESLGRGGCKIDSSGQASCIAIAESDDGMSWVMGSWDTNPETREEANQRALNDCERDGESCQITTNQCAGQ